MSKFNYKCLVKIEHWAQIRCGFTDFAQPINWLELRRRNDKMKIVKIAAVEAIVYNIWRVRNEAFWLHKVGSIDNIVQSIQR